MINRNRLVRSSLLAGFFLACLTVPARAGGDDPPQADKSKTGYTLDEALGQLHVYPRDPYLQYVALQLARRENRMDDAVGMINRFAGFEDGNRRAGRRGDVDLFSIFTGALAVQESLQLDTMRNVRSRSAGRNTLFFSRNGLTEEQRANMREEREAARIAQEKRRKETNGSSRSKPILSSARSTTWSSNMSP
ncbi:MAG: hypothetical protein HY290_05710 [Planctomycetia bacterium]|nr:hypothetical protein [Planctomycetia bacterium]